MTPTTKGDPPCPNCDITHPWRDHSDPASEALLAAIEDHSPDIASWIDDSSWLVCSCGWDSSESKIGWTEHVLATTRTDPKS